MKEILYFSAQWCGPCRMLGPIMESLKDEINYKKIDVDENQQLSTQYQIKGIPTLVLTEDGTDKGRIVGVKSKEEILSFYNG